MSVSKITKDLEKTLKVSLAKSGVQEALKIISNNQKRNKYNATKTTIRGIKFDSKLESQAYLLLEHSKLDFDLQPKIVIQEKFKTKFSENVGAITYTPDFVIYSSPDGITEKHYLDIKGMETTVFKLKAKMFKKKLEEKSQQCNYFYTIKTLGELELLIKNLK